MTKKQREIVEEEIILLYKEDVRKITGWGENKVNDVFANDKTFPAIKTGKRHQVELEALHEYLKKGNNKNID